MSKRSRRIARFIRAAMEAYPHKRTFSAMSHYGAELMVAVEKQHKQMELFEAELDAILNNVRRLPLQADDFFKDVWVLPCWIETKDGALWADILDKDSRGFYCRSNPSRILKPDEYGMTWRCWIGVYPSTKERANAMWRNHSNE